MSTNAAILRQTQAGEFGVYCHSDGQPISLGKFLWHSYRGHFNHDLEAMLRFVIDEHPAGWSVLQGTDLNLPAGWAEAPDRPAGVPLAEWFKSPTYRRWADSPRCYCHGGRTENANILNLRENTTPWAYVFDIDENSLSIYYSWGSNENPVAILDLEGDEPDWAVIECGQNLERCHHYAWVHFPEVKKTKAGNLNTHTYLGTREFELHDAIAFIIEGKRYETGGGGFDTGALSREGFPPGYWAQYVKVKGRKDVPKLVARNTKRGRVPTDGVVWVFPPTLPKPFETFRGTQ